jgi:hypothetical protein
MVETMEETLKQHRPTARFDQRVKKVLEGIGRIHWRTTSPLCFVGSVVAALRHLGEQLEPDYVMGISGGAFKAFWIPPWSPANCDLLLAGEEPVRRTFGALGYGYTVIRDYDRLDPAHTKEFFREPIVRSLDAGRPVLAIGIVGPPECCVVAGYDKGGDVLYGRSYFQPEAGGYFRSEDWYENIHGLILIGEKQGQPPQEEILRSTLEWAIELARRPEFPARLPSESGDSDRIVSGLAAYDAMAKALLDDAAFEPSDREGFTLRIVALGNDGLWLMWDARDIAARFLRQVASWVAPAAVRQELLAAAEAYAREVAVLKKTTALYPCTCEFPVIQKLPENVRAVADPKLRRKVSRLVLEARSIEEEAVGHLEKALAGLGS